GADYVVVPDGSRWTVDQGSGQLGNQISEEVQRTGDPLELCAAVPPGQSIQRALHIGQSLQRATQRPQVARTRSPCGRASGESLDVADPIEGVPQSFAPAGVAYQNVHRVEPGLDRRYRTERSEQPAAQQSAAHRRHGPVEYF